MNSIIGGSFRALAEILEGATLSETDPQTGPAGFMLSPGCHAGASVRVILDAGKMFLACGQCWKRIAQIAFVSERPPEPFDPDTAVGFQR